MGQSKPIQEVARSGRSCNSGGKMTATMLPLPTRFRHLAPTSEKRCTTKDHLRHVWIKVPERCKSRPCETRGPVSSWLRVILFVGTQMPEAPWGTDTVKARRNARSNYETRETTASRDTINKRISKGTTNKRGEQVLPDTKWETNRPPQR